MIMLMIILIIQDLAKYSCLDVRTPIPLACVVVSFRCIRPGPFMSVSGFSSIYAGSSSRISDSLSRGELQAGQNQLLSGTKVSHDGHVLSCLSMGIASQMLFRNDNADYLICP